MKKIFRARDMTEAHIVRGMLAAHGIDAHVDGQFLQGGIGELPVVDLMSISVPDELEARARALIHLYETGAMALDDEDCLEA